jgi:tetratricopeptide (TPR) repeat protein
MYIKKAKALNRMERYREALDSANLAIAIDSKNEEGYSVKVEPLFHLGREEELTAVLEEIIVINPHSPLKAFLNCLRKDRDKAQY